MTVACRVCGDDMEPYGTGYDDDFDDYCERHPVCVLCCEPFDEEADGHSADGACPDCTAADGVTCPECGEVVVDLAAHGCESEFPGACAAEVAHA